MKALLVVVVALASGCGAVSHYQRTTAPPDEIVWAYDGAPVATKGGITVGRPPTWDGLSEAVACVPEAQAYAETAHDNGVIGLGLQWTGLGLMIASPVVGLGVPVALTVVTLANPVGVVVGVFGGIGLGVVTFAVGYGVTLAATPFLTRAFPAAVDAVNAYDDAYERCRH